jgi:hypothetical protein
MAPRRLLEGHRSLALLADDSGLRLSEIRRRWCLLWR